MILNSLKIKIISIGSLGIVLGACVLPARGEWLNYLVRTSGLAWSDGYHAYDQCPPKQRHHFPIRHPFVLPGYAAAAPHAPYYFEGPEQQEVLPSAPAQQPVPAPATNGSAPSSASYLPDPQAHYKPHSRYFQALQGEARGIEQGQPAQQQARRQPTSTGVAPPF